MNARDPRAHRRAIALMIAAPTLWSIAGVVTRQLEYAGRWEVTFWRSLFAALFVLAAMLFTRGRGAWAAVRATGGYGLLSGAMWAIMFIAFSRTNEISLLLPPPFYVRAGNRPAILCSARSSPARQARSRSAR